MIELIGYLVTGYVVLYFLPHVIALAFVLPGAVLVRISMWMEGWIVPEELSREKRLRAWAELYDRPYYPAIVGRWLLVTGKSLGNVGFGFIKRVEPYFDKLPVHFSRADWFKL